MIRMLICCGGGFSSSYLSVRMQKEIRNKHLEDYYQIDFQSFSLIEEKMDNYDVILCCPHLRVSLEIFLKNHNPPVPFYLIPPRIYGRMELDEIVTDALDIIDLFKNRSANPVYFPGENNILTVKRYKAYHHVHKGF